MKRAATTSRTSSKNFEFDQSLIATVFMLMGIGLVTVYSASFIFASENFGDALFFFKRQAFFFVVSLVALFGLAYFPHQLLKKFFWFFFAVFCALCVAVFIPGLGHRAGGAYRWINLPFGMHIEPAEIGKLMSAIAFAFLLTRKIPEGEKRSRRWGLWLLAIGVPTVLLLKQPDFGSTVIFWLVGLSILFCFGLHWAYLLGAFLCALPAFYFLVWRVDYRLKRVISFLNPWKEQSEGGFQVIQSLLGFFNGGFFGTGLGQGQSKLYFLPEAHTDFILSVWAEEAGFVGVIIVFGLFLWVVVRGLQIAVETHDPFSKRLALGLTALIGFQAVINGGVVLGLLPTKGLTLPFLSYGGSSLICSCTAIGILLNIHRQNIKAGLKIR